MLWRGSDVLREALWGLEERILWPGSDAARRVGSGVARASAPIRRVVDTKIAWPLTDAIRRRGTAARVGIAGAAVAAAVAAGAVGTLAGAGRSSEATPAAPHVAAKSEGVDSVSVLRGAAPDFEVGHTKVATTSEPLPSDPPARVAWRFADAFVSYEVGKLNQRTAAVFAATVTSPLAKSLSKEPPRLPAGTKVPQARVLNVVLADRTAKRATASVSMLRLQAISEVRLTLLHTDRGWRVTEVLG